MPTVGKHRGRRALCGLAFGAASLTAQGVAPSYADDCKYFSALPDDCARAGLRKFDGLRDYRYQEIELFAKDPLKKVLYVTIYDTTGLNGGDDTHDSAPASFAQSLDPKRIAKQYQALAARIDPPYHWTVDWLADRVGTVRSFDGLNAAWMGNSLTSGAAMSPKPAAHRLSSRLDCENCGRRLQERVRSLPARRPQGPDLGDGLLRQDMPDLTIDKLKALGDVLKLPQGWKFRTAVLTKDLILEPKAGFVGVCRRQRQPLPFDRSAAEQLRPLIPNPFRSYPYGQDKRNRAVLKGVIRPKV